MLSKERAQWMVNDLTKRLSELMNKIGNSTYNPDDVNFEIEKIKESLNFFKTELMKMEKDDLTSIDDINEEPTISLRSFYEKKDNYEGVNSWGMFVQRLNNKKVNPQKVKEHLKKGNNRGM